MTFLHAVERSEVWSWTDPGLNSSSTNTLSDLELLKLSETIFLPII